jgi:phosphoribosylanthranilate isomerase
VTPGEGLVVKICGLRAPGAAVDAAAAGADLLGFNFAPVSKRRVAVEVAREAILAVLGQGFAAHEPGLTPPARQLAPGARREATGLRRRTPAGPGMVGIFVNQPLAEVTAVARSCGLDAVQLSGDEDAAYCRAVGSATGLPVIKALRLAGPDDERRGAAYVAAGGVAALLVDAPVAGAWGGCGRAL